MEDDLKIILKILTPVPKICPPKKQDQSGFAYF